MNLNLSFIFIIFFNFLFLFFYRKISHIYKVFDLPDRKRKIHTKKIPLLGGLIIFLNIIFFYLSINFKENYSVIFIIGCFSFFIFGLIDDKKNLNANLKLLLQSLFLLSYFFYNQDVVISNFYFSSLKKDLFLNSFSIIFSIVCFLLFINSINMFDGINLQVGFYSLFIFLLLLFFKVDNQFIIPIIIALIFFLVLNFNNNSFLGNSGSYLLGFIISYFFSISSNIFSAEQIFLVMLIPGLDMLRVAVFRIIHKKHPFSSDKNHIHYLMLSKFKFYQTFIIIQLLIILPVVLDIFFKNKFTIFFIIISIIIYSSIIYLLTSKKLNK
jgi:UDP-GlcNAc:undecaprenyl-phosphate GlcNAc-1-phosphate transferase